MNFEDLDVKRLWPAKYAALGLALAALFCGCTESGSGDGKKIAGGVTDIGNSVALAGIVMDQAGSKVASARVVAYYDSWSQISALDSVEAFTDSVGEFTMYVDSASEVVLYAEHGGVCGLARIDDDDDNTLVLGERKRLESSVSGATSGYVRIVGTDEVAKIGKDGSFAFDSVPPGDISLVFIQDSEPQGYLEFRTVDDRRKIELPPLENRRENGKFSSPAYRDDTYGVDFGRFNEYEGPADESPDTTSHFSGKPASDTALVPADTSRPSESPALDTLDTLDYPENDSNSFHLDSGVRLFNGDGSSAGKVEYIDGKYGKAVSLSQGQYIDLGEKGFIPGDFTLSLWVKWNGDNKARQILFGQKGPNDSTAFLWFYEPSGENFAVTLSVQGKPFTSYFTGVDLPTDEWTMLALVSSKGTLSMYKGNTLYIMKNSNGDTLQAPGGNMNNNGEFGAADGKGGYAQSSTLFLGGMKGLDESWNGAVDEVHLEHYAQNLDWVNEGQKP